MRFKALVVFAAVLFVSQSASAECVAVKACNGWRIRPLFRRCVPVCPVPAKPICVEVMPIEYRTPVRNFVFGTHKVVPVCKNGKCEK